MNKLLALLHKLTHLLCINNVQETRVYEPYSKRVLITLRCVNCEWVYKMWSTDGRLGEVTRRGGPCRRNIITRRII